MSAIDPDALRLLIDASEKRGLTCLTALLPRAGRPAALGDGSSLVLLLMALTSTRRASACARGTSC